MEVTEAQLKDFGLLHEWGGVWKYSSLGGKPMTAKDKDGAVEAALGNYRYYKKNKPELLKTKEQRDYEANCELFLRWHRVYGGKTVGELEALIRDFDKQLEDLSKGKKSEVNGMGGRRTAVAVRNEAYRQVGESKFGLGVYLGLLREGFGAKFGVHIA